MKFQNVAKILSVGVIALVMSGCGSSSSSGGSSSNPDPSPGIIDSGYNSRDNTNAIYHIQGNGHNYQTDNGCVYPEFIHTEYHYEIYDNNTVYINYGTGSKEVEYTCNIIKKYQTVTVNDGAIDAVYYGDGTWANVLYFDRSTGLYYNVNKSYSVDLLHSQLIEVKNGGTTVTILDNSSDEADVLIQNICKEVPLNT